jgi:hypothetical protein
VEGFITVAAFTDAYSKFFGQENIMAPGAGILICFTDFISEYTGVVVVVFIVKDNNTGKSICSCGMAVIAATGCGRILTGYRCHQRGVVARNSVSVPDVVNHGTMTGGTVTDSRIANGRIGSLCDRKQVMD